MHCFLTRFSENALRPFEGVLEINTRLKKAKLLFPGELVQPEAFVRDNQGKRKGGGGELDNPYSSLHRLYLHWSG